MVFHIPFSVGTLKVFVATTPTEGHTSIMRVRTFIDSANPLVWGLGWLVAGVSASQLAADINIMEHKGTRLYCVPDGPSAPTRMCLFLGFTVRLKKPLKQLNDGPASRVSGWLRQFYSASSESVGRAGFVPDW